MQDNKEQTKIEVIKLCGINVAHPHAIKKINLFPSLVILVILAILN